MGGVATTDTYSYLLTTETVLRISTSGGSTAVTDSAVTPTGDRLGVKVGAAVNWLLPDLHGDVAGSLSGTDETQVVNAIRYDAYGETLATGSAGGTPVGQKHWKYQGRLDIAPEGLGTPLYDMSARFYAPGIGAFTQLDSVMGSAQNPLSMNRFLYAHANPATLTDPTGHCAGTRICNIDGDGASGQDPVIAHTRLAKTNHRNSLRSLPRTRDFWRYGTRRERAWSGGSDAKYIREARAVSIGRQVAAKGAVTYAGQAGMTDDIYRRRNEVVRHEATALELLGMPAAVLGGGLLGAVAPIPAALNPGAAGAAVAGGMTAKAVTNWASDRDLFDGVFDPADIAINASTGGISGVLGGVKAIAGGAVLGGGGNALSTAAHGGSGEDQAIAASDGGIVGAIAGVFPPLVRTGVTGLLTSAGREAAVQGITAASPTRNAINGLTWWLQEQFKNADFGRIPGLLGNPGLP